MDNITKVLQLRSYIYDTLSPLIKKDIIYLDTPHHFNSGDTLIWEGTEHFIKQLSKRCHYTADADSFVSVKAQIWAKRHSSDMTILLHGGGNFGDLWPKHQMFRNSVVLNCPKSHIVILPQTIWYEDKATLEKDAQLYKGRTNITLCVRDRVSFKIACEYFPDNNPILVPDMAFCIPFESASLPSPTRDNLFVKRIDKEIDHSIDYGGIVPADSVVSDWPTISEEHPLQNFHPALLDWAMRFDVRLGTHMRERLDNYYWNSHLRPEIVKSAVDFIGGYKNVYTTRMHAAILSVMLNRERIVLFDNSYGKSSSFAEAWFSDLDGFELITMH